VKVEVHDCGNNQQRKQETEYDPTAVVSRLDRRIVAGIGDTSSGAHCRFSIGQYDPLRIA